MKNFKILLLALLVVSLVAIAWENPRATHITQNLQVRGWVMAGPNNTVAGERTWGSAGTADTLLVTGVDTLTVVTLTPKVSKSFLKYQCENDTIFVSSDSSETTATKYSYFIVRNGYGATD